MLYLKKLLVFENVFSLSFLLDLVGFVGYVSNNKKNLQKTRDFFYVYLKTAPTEVQKILISSHKNMKIIRQKFKDAFFDKTPVLINKVNPGKDIFFFNAYSFISDVSSQMCFGLNDADAVKLRDITDAGLVTSVVGELKFIANETKQEYLRGGNKKSQRMREALFSDGTKTLKLTLWADMIDDVSESQLIQLVNISSKNYGEEISLSTLYSTTLCYLTESLDIEFDEVDTESQESVQGGTEVKVCCPTVESFRIEEIRLCKFCSNKVRLLSGQGMYHCDVCNRDMPTAVFRSNPDCVRRTVLLDIVNEHTAMVEKLYEKALKENLGDNAYDDELALKNYFFSLRKTDFLVTKGNIVSDLIEHED